MASIFTKIIDRDIPAYIVAEDEFHIAFLDINPLSLGHTLVIPKNEIDYLFNLSDSALSALTLFSKKVAQAIEKTISCNRIGISVMGLEIPHAHIHLIPINSLDDMNFSKTKLSPTKVEMEVICENIKSALEQ